MMVAVCVEAASRLKSASTPFVAGFSFGGVFFGFFNHFPLIPPKVFLGMPILIIFSWSAPVF
jgi:hypothetical protein